MTCRSEEDDVQAEKQIQTSLQHTVNDWTGLQSPCGNQEKGQPLAEVEDLDEATRMHGLPMQARTSSNVEFPRLPRSCELAKTARYADHEQPPRVDLHRRDPIQSPGRRALKELGVSTMCSATSRFTADMGKAHQEESNEITGSQLGTHHSDLVSDLNVNRKNPGTPTATLTQKPHRGTISTALASLNEPLTAVSANILVNPWTKFTSTVDTDRFMKDTTSSTFHPTNKCPIAAARRPQNCELTSDRQSASCLLNEHVANSQRTAGDTMLRRNVKNPFGACVSSKLTTRTHDVAAADSVTVANAKAASIGEQEIKPTISNNRRDDFFGGLHPSRLTMMSVAKAPTTNKINTQSRGKIDETVRKSSRSEVAQPITRRITVKHHKRPLSQVESNRCASSASHGNPKTKTPKLGTSCARTVQRVHGLLSCVLLCVLWSEIAFFVITEYVGTGAKANITCKTTVSLTTVSVFGWSKTSVSAKVCRKESEGAQFKK